MRSRAVRSIIAGIVVAAMMGTMVFVGLGQFWQGKDFSDDDIAEIGSSLATGVAQIVQASHAGAASVPAPVIVVGGAQLALAPEVLQQLQILAAFNGQGPADPDYLATGTLSSTRVLGRDDTIVEIEYQVHLSHLTGAGESWENITPYELSINTETGVIQGLRIVDPELAYWQQNDSREESTV